MKEIADSDSEIVFLSLPEEDPTRRRPDVTLAQQLLGWVPQVPLREGLIRLHEYYVAQGVAVSSSAA